MLGREKVYAEYIKAQIENTKKYMNDKEVLQYVLKTYVNASKEKTLCAEQKMIIYATIGIMYAEGLME